MHATMAANAPNVSAARRRVGTARRRAKTGGILCAARALVRERGARGESPPRVVGNPRAVGIVSTGAAAIHALADARPHAPSFLEVSEAYDFELLRISGARFRMCAHARGGGALANAMDREGATRSRGNPSLGEGAPTAPLICKS